MTIIASLLVHRSVSLLLTRSVRNFFGKFRDFGDNF